MQAGGLKILLKNGLQKYGGRKIPHHVFEAA
jgi:hypothetical protein